jgi:ABC-type transporter Mla subunit MlaD
MASKATTNNVLTGLFLIIGLVSFVTCALVLAGLEETLRTKRSYEVRFALADGVEGLSDGSAVKIGGITRGRVTRIDMVDNAVLPAGVEIVATIALDARVALKKDAVAFLQRPLLGGTGWMNIPELGSAESEALPPGGVLRGQIAPPAIFAEAGFGPEQRAQVQGIIRSAKGITETVEVTAKRLDEISAKLQKDADAFSGRLIAAADDVKDVTGRARATTPEWIKEGDTILAKVNKAGDELNATLTDARALIASFQKEVDAAKDRVQSVVRNADEFVSKLNTDGYKRFTDALDAAKAGIDAGRATLVRAEAIVRDNDQSVRDTLANLRIASDQLAITTAEVRRQPWRLLYQPARRELEQELLFDSARRYSEAAGDLNRAVQALAQVQGTLAKSPSERTPDERDQLERLRRQAEEALGAFGPAQQQFLKVLGVPGK